MADEIITNGILLEHIQAIHGELLTVKQDLQQQIARVDAKVDRLEQKVHQGFEEARQHRQALQEDLDATIRMVGKHEVKLTRL